MYLCLKLTVKEKIPIKKISSFENYQRLFWKTNNHEKFLEFTYTMPELHLLY